MPATRTSLPGRCGRGQVEEVPGQPVGRRPSLFGRALHARPPGRRQHRRQRKDGQESERRVNRNQEGERHA